jgi:hypothetical protein
VSDSPKPEAKEKRCNCPRCRQDTRVRGVIRRGDKFEMRAMIRELHELCTNLGEELDDLEEVLHRLTCNCDHENDEKPQVVN